MEAPGYDPSVSTHKASSISSTSTASTWDYPLSNFSGNEDTPDESIIQNASGFEDYHFGPTIERLSFPGIETNNNHSLSKGKKQHSSNQVSSEREEKFFANFITSASTAEENGLPELISPLNSTSAAYFIEDTKQQSGNHEARIPEKERDYHEAEKSLNVENDSIIKTDLFTHISPIALVNDSSDASMNSRKKRSADAISKHSKRPIHPKSATTEMD
ncbi:hypothetical protein K501DRAFT_8278 [Backusella circina FSU 941]|nr:hypothetical protein K501DRAFT_8278 [Backusella circina FSU 941]